MLYRTSEVPAQAPLNSTLSPSDGERDDSDKSPAPHLQAQNFAGFTFGEDLEGAAANLAIRREALLGDGGVNGQLEGLAAERALDGLGDLHGWVRESAARAQPAFRLVRLGRSLPVLVK